MGQCYLTLLCTQLPGAPQEVSENVMATGHYNTYMLLLKDSEHICGIVAGVHSSAEFQ
jgi:hypothetical protein